MYASADAGDSWSPIVRDLPAVLERGGADDRVKGSYRGTALAVPSRTQVRLRACRAQRPGSQTHLGELRPVGTRVKRSEYGTAEADALIRSIPVVRRLFSPHMLDENAIAPLKEFLSKVPAIEGKIGSGLLDDGCWWVKFAINVEHRLAWRVVQELGHVLNYLSVSERLPTVFMPVSPPPYLNGAPKEFLSWVIECRDMDFKPETCVQWLEGRLPQPVNDEEQWKTEDE